MDYKVKTYEDAVKIINEIGFLPLASLVPEYPSLNSITSKESWHTDTEYDPWIWRTKFSTDGVAGYGKFIQKKSILISRDLLPYVKKVLGYNEFVEDRYLKGNVSREALSIYKIIDEEAGIDTRVLRKKAGLQDKENKKVFDHALQELQGTMDIVISGIKEQKDENGEKNGWNSTAFETYESWSSRNGIQEIIMKREEAKDYLLQFFAQFASPVSVKKFKKIFK
ncbi:hypothetical protein ACFSCX_12485 [Bacillus salitolerans]|uniref:Uncharacterized protein n=1 Tax=Bacillus salitolerans TaxID=1437434 RepID=A0ABW4LQP1_9BACI